MMEIAVPYDRRRGVDWRAMPGLTREQIELVDTARQVDDVLAMPQHLEDALWRVESAGLDRALRAGRRARAPDRLRHGRQRDRRRPRAGRARRPAHQADDHGARLPASRRGRRPARSSCARATPATPRRRSPATRPPARSARVRVAVTTGGRLAERGARGRRARDPAARRPAAACRRRLHDRCRRSRSRRWPAWRRACAPRSTRPPPGSSGSRAEWGPDADSDSLAKRVAQRINGTCVCVYGAGADRGRRDALEDPAEREREAAGVRGRAARGRPQRDRRLAGRRRRSAASRPCSSRTSTSTRACASASS